MKRKSGKPIVDLEKKPSVVHFNVGSGYLTYTISPKATLATGTVIPNVAVVVFDAGQPIATNACASCFNSIFFQHSLAEPRHAFH